MEHTSSPSDTYSHHPDTFIKKQKGKPLYFWHSGWEHSGGCYCTCHPDDCLCEKQETSKAWEKQHIIENQNLSTGAKKLQTLPNYYTIVQEPSFLLWAWWLGSNLQSMGIQSSSWVTGTSNYRKNASPRSLRWTKTFMKDPLQTRIALLHKEFPPVLKVGERKGKGDVNKSWKWVITWEWTSLKRHGKYLNWIFICLVFLIIFSQGVRMRRLD